MKIMNNENIASFVALKNMLRETDNRVSLA